MMKRAPWYLVVARVAGFAGVLALHSRAAPAPSALGAAGKSGRPAESRRGPAPARPPGLPEQPAQRARRGRRLGWDAHSATWRALGSVRLRRARRQGHRESRNRITNVTVPALQTADPYLPQQIADQAIPMLRSEVLAADSASINGVSGATFTSEVHADVGAGGPGQAAPFR